MSPAGRAKGGERGRVDIIICILCGETEAQTSPQGKCVDIFESETAHGRAKMSGSESSVDCFLRQLFSHSLQTGEPKMQTHCILHL